MLSWLNEQLEILHSVYYKSKKIWQETPKLELFVDVCINHMCKRVTTFIFIPL